MSRRKQGIPKKSDGGDEEEASGDRTEQGPESEPSLGEPEGGSGETRGESGETEGGSGGREEESDMPILESGQPRRRSPSPPSSPPRMSQDDTKVLKMKSPEELLANPMDILKNSPFLLPAHLLALNPQLYAAQLAQLQAAQMMLNKQAEGGTDEEGGRKRPGEDFSDGFNMAKQPRSGSPQPMDLSGSKSPDLKHENKFNPFSPLMPAGLLSMMQMMQGRPPVSSPSASPSPPSPRHVPTSPWQAQWASKHHDSKPEDVFKCVWCKESYNSLEMLTRHMKEAKHHSMPQYPGMGGPRPGPPSSSPIRASAPLPSPPRQRDILRDQVPLPRKLVRGQDVWIGRADEQTRDILKCMGCGASFRSLDQLTKHMQETQHYKKVISQDQISSWKFPEVQSSPKNHVNSVLTCKVCDKGFSSLKELSDHMIRNNHYSSDAKPLGARAPPTAAQAQAAKERKKALPVKKLLELERARQEVAGTQNPISSKEIMESGKLPCERCEEKIPIDIFIPHIQQCVGRPRFLKTPSSEPASPPSSNKDTNTGSKSEPKEAGADGGSSILGSLEQLVKGNFVASSSSRTGAVASPPTAQISPLGKFSINNLFPNRDTSSPDSPMDSKPSSPSSSRSGPTSLLPQPSLEAMLDSPMDPQRVLASPHNGDRQSPHSEGSGSSPSPEGEKVACPAVPGSLVEGAKKGGNALAALQMFCNDQKKNPKAGSAEKDGGNNCEMSDPGAILAFSWACNQAVSADSAIKCPFCDTPFISKGAYRHHLSKMHFTKENLGSLAASQAHIPTGAGAVAGATRSPSPADTKEGESLQSKYQKYSQLAKQLSCYDGPTN